jgi:hypothetical protein
MGKRRRAIDGHSPPVLSQRRNMSRRGKACEAGYPASWEGLLAGEASNTSLMFSSPAHPFAAPLANVQKVSAVKIVAVV